MTRLKHDQSGFTLVELLVAITIGTIVMLAAVGLVDAAVDGQRKVENKIEAVQRGRDAMERISRQLRSQICPGRGVAPVVVAEDERVTFYASLAPPPPGTGPVRIEKRSLTFVRTSGDRGDVVERIYVPTGTAPDLVFPPDDSPTRQSTIAHNVAAIPGTPVFRYWKYDPALSPELLLLAPPVSDSDRALIVQVGTTFEAYPTNPREAEKVKTRLDSKVFVRTADPTDPEHSPKCI